MKKIVKTFALMTTMIVMASGIVNAQTLEDAIKNLDAERFAAAGKVFNQLAETSPSPQTLFYKGYSLLKTPEGLTADNLKIAQEAFTKGNTLAGKPDPMNQIGLGMVKLAGKDFAGAKLIFEEVKKATKSKNTDVLYRIAEAYTLFSNANDPAEAIININMALEKSKVKDNPEYFFVKSDAFMLKNEGGDAMNALQNAERLNKKPGKTYEKMAKVWLQGKNYPEAKMAIDKGIAADPSHAPIYKYQSSYFQSRNDYNESAKAAKKYLENSDTDCKAKLRYSKLAFIAKDFENVKKTIDEIKSCNSDPYVYRMSGIMSFEEKKPTEAIALLKTFIEKAPKDDNPGLDYGYIGRSYLIMPAEGEAKKANDSLGIWNIEKAIAMGDTSFNYYQDMAGSLYKNKNYVKAAYFAEKNATTKKNPNAADFATVGSYYNAARNYVKSDEYVDKALALYQDKWADGYALSARVKSFKSIGVDSAYSANFTAAPLYEKYLSLIGEAGKADAKNKRNVSDALKYLAGREFQVNKNKEKAIAYLTELLKYDPTNAEVQAQLDAINGIVKPAPVTPPATVVPGTKPVVVPTKPTTPTTPVKKSK
jgi:tetratricopeptide (TPR) repeat protein